MTNLLEQSWNNFDKEYAKKYLHYFPKQLHNFAVEHIFRTKNNPSIIDVGCGNCQLYNIIENFRRDFSYTGIDWSTPLLDSFDYKNKNNCEIICGDILKEETYKKKYDCAVVSHIVELVDSPEKLFYMLSKNVEYIYVIWYEYPRFDFSHYELKNYVNSFNEEKNIFSPYLRSKLSQDYFNFILQKNNLIIEEKIAMSEKDILTIIKSKDMKKC